MSIKILFLDQSGQLGGAELCLLDIVKEYRDHCLVGLLSDGCFRERLEQAHIPVQVLAHQAITVRKHSNTLQGVWSLLSLNTTIAKTVKLSRQFDLIYANTPKALVVGAIASVLSHRPLVYHLHDIISPDHFSDINRWLLVTLANQFATLMIANSHASLQAFVAAGGQAKQASVLYNGFQPAAYHAPAHTREAIRRSLGIQPDQFVVGCFSRLSPWKGQHVFLEALKYCPANVIGILVGDALFGEQDYVQQLHQQVILLGLQQRVHFLGFRSDIIPLMGATDLVAHTSTAPEPFGRVIVEAMLSQRPVVATRAGGAIEIINHGVNGWLTTPANATELATMIEQCRLNPHQAAAIAYQGRLSATQQFDLQIINHQLRHLLSQVI